MSQGPCPTESANSFHSHHLQTCHLISASAILIVFLCNIFLKSISSREAIARLFSKVSRSGNVFGVLQTPQSQRWASYATRSVSVAQCQLIKLRYLKATVSANFLQLTLQDFEKKKKNFSVALVEPKKVQLTLTKFPVSNFVAVLAIEKATLEVSVACLSATLTCSVTDSYANLQRN